MKKRYGVRPFFFILTFLGRFAVCYALFNILNNTTLCKRYDFLWREYINVASGKYSFLRVNTLKGYEIPKKNVFNDLITNSFVKYGLYSMSYDFIPYVQQ